MSLDKLPDDVLLHLFSYCNAKDIETLRITNQRLFDHITHYRVRYKTIKAFHLRIRKTKNGEHEIRVKFPGRVKVKIVPPGSLSSTISSLNPFCLLIEDSEEFANLTPLWWKGEKRFVLNKTLDYRRYLPYFDRCTIILIDSSSPKKLTEILRFMETKHLMWFSLEGDGELECTDDDLRKIGRISNKLRHLCLKNVSASSMISNDAVLDMIEIGSLNFLAPINISRIENFNKMEECLKKRNWVIHEKKQEYELCIRTSNGLMYCIRSGE